MRVLLVNPWIYDFAAYDLWAKPVGLISVGSQLRELGCEVALIDCLDRFHPFMDEYKTKASIYGDGHYYVQEIDTPVCLSDIPRSFKLYGMPLSIFNRILEKMQKPDIILVNSGLTYWYLGAFFAIKMLKERFKATPIILGGIYATLCFKHAVTHSGADYVFKENTMVDLIITIKRITKNPTLVVQHNNGVHSFNIAAYDLYPRLPYITMFTSRGCVFSCSYCGWKAVVAQYRTYDPLEIVETIVHFRTKYHVENFAFYSVGKHK